MKKSTAGISILIFSQLVVACGHSKGTPPPAVPDASTHVEKENQLIIPERKVGDELTRATELYGPAIVYEGNFFMDTKARPWSGFWFPFAEENLYKGASAPLHKYDLFAATRHKVTHAVDFEQAVHARGGFESWAGRCNSWAIASVMEPEPFLEKPVTVNGVTFTTADLKALVTLTYDHVEGVTQFGQRFNGDEKSVPEDIYPDQFHRIIQKEIFENRRPFIMDKDMGIEIWNVPVYKAELTLLKDESNPHLFHVKAALVGAAPLDPESDPNSRDRKNVVYTYTYDLFGYAQADGRFKVAYGVWTGESAKSHPDFIWTLPAAKERNSYNKEVDVQLVEEILKHTLTPSPTPTPSPANPR